MSKFHSTGAMQKLTNKAFSRSEILSRSSLQDNALSVDNSLFSRSSSAPHKVESSQIYIPVNYIQPEVLAMFRSWELLKIKNYKDQKGFSGTELSPKTVNDQSIYEPLRTVPNFDPPKRFFRRFWRNSARQILLRNRSGPNPSASTDQHSWLDKFKNSGKASHAHGTVDEGRRLLLPQGQQLLYDFWLCDALKIEMQHARRVSSHSAPSQSPSPASIDIRKRLQA